MTLEELIAAAADIDRALTNRVHVYRVIVEPTPDGPRETGQRIYRGSFYQPRTNQGESNQ